MLNKLLNKLKNKTIGYWLACGAALIALVALIIFGVYKGQRGTGSTGIYALIIFGILFQIALFFYGGRFSPILTLGATILYTLAAGFSLVGGVGNITDYFSGIICFGVPELAPLNIAIAVLLVVSILLSIVTCFLRTEKKK